MSDDPIYVQFKLRMPETLKARLDRAAQDSGRSVSAELIHRLEQSFRSLQETLVANRYAEIRMLDAQVRDLDAQAVRLSALLDQARGPQFSGERKSLLAELNNIDRSVRVLKQQRDVLYRDIEQVQTGQVLVRPE